jgi:hypothetical protein
MVLAAHHAAQPREKAFSLIGAAFRGAVGLAVIDAAGQPASVQGIPMRTFVGVHGGGTGHDALGDIDARAFGPFNECRRAVLALAERDHDAALAGDRLPLHASIILITSDDNLGASRG